MTDHSEKGLLEAESSFESSTKRSACATTLSSSIPTPSADPSIQNPNHQNPTQREEDEDEEEMGFRIIGGGGGGPPSGGLGLGSVAINPLLSPNDQRDLLGESNNIISYSGGSRGQHVVLPPQGIHLETEAPKKTEQEQQSRKMEQDEVASTTRTTPPPGQSSSRPAQKTRMDLPVVRSTAQSITTFVETEVAGTNSNSASNSRRPPMPGGGRRSQSVISSQSTPNRHDSGGLEFNVTFEEEEEEEEEALQLGGGGCAAEDRGFEQYEEVQARGIVPLRDKIYFLFDGVPASLQLMDELKELVPYSYFTVNLTMLLVGISCISFSVETLPQFHNNPHIALTVIEVVCVIWFTIDILVRVICVRSKLSFLLQPMNWIDIGSVLPFYVGLFTAADDGGDGSTRSSSSSPSSSSSTSGVELLVMLRVLRLVRAIRVFKLSKGSKGLQTVTEAMTRSTGALSLLGFLLFVMLIIFASVFYFTEQLEQHWDDNQRLWIRTEDGTVSPFQSIIHSVWFAVVTITTVGYGDDYPYHPVTKVAAIGLMLTAAFVIAFPTVVLSANFHDAHSETNSTEAQQERDYYKQTVLEGAVVMNRRDRAHGQASAVFQVNEENDLAADQAAQKSRPPTGSAAAVSVRRPVPVDDGVDGYNFLDTEILEDNPLNQELQEEESSLAAARSRHAVKLRKKFPRERLVNILRSRSIVQRSSTVLRYHLGTKAPPREIYVFDSSESALYAPLLMLRCGSRDGEHAYGAHSDTRARLSLRHNFPDGFTATFTLLLQTRLSHARARSALDKAEGGRFCGYTLEPAKIKKLTTMVHSSHALLSNAIVTTSEYLDPYGAVPIEIFVPKLDALTILLKYSGSMGFTFIVEYYSGEIATVSTNEGRGRGITGVSVIESWTSSRTATVSRRTAERSREDNGTPLLQRGPSFQLCPTATLLSPAEQRQLIFEHSVRRGGEKKKGVASQGEEEEEEVEKEVIVTEQEKSAERPRGVGPASEKWATDTSGRMGNSLRVQGTTEGGRLQNLNDDRRRSRHFFFALDSSGK